MAALAAILGLAVVIWGGYAGHWSWTGINGGTATLWDWLHLLLLPVVVGVLPIWMSRKNRLSRPVKAAALAGVGAFTMLVLFGYEVPWGWTGFVGNRLWDWLELLALPLALALTPIIDELREGWGARQTLLALAVTVAFAAVVLGGYVEHWGWTGFTGNTLWNWMQLLLLPLLLPMVVVPALKPRAMAVVTIVEPDRPVAEATRAEADDLARAEADEPATRGEAAAELPRMPRPVWSRPRRPQPAKSAL
jgi:hypothetical protein